MVFIWLGGYVLGGIGFVVIIVLVDCYFGDGFVFVEFY